MGDTIIIEEDKPKQPDVIVVEKEKPAPEKVVVEKTTVRETHRVVE